MEERLRDLETERQQEIQRQILKEEAEQRAKEEELRNKEKELKEAERERINKENERRQREKELKIEQERHCLLYTSPSPRDS